jgi:hypothetical protein
MNVLAVGNLRWGQENLRYSGRGASRFWSCCDVVAATHAAFGAGYRMRKAGRLLGLDLAFSVRRVVQLLRRREARAGGLRF